MSQPTPKIGDTNVRGFVLPDTCHASISALPSLYGFYRCDEYNPLLFDAIVGTVPFPENTEVLFDVTDAQTFGGGAIASNVRRA